MSNFSLLKERIKDNEGFRNTAYKDSLGFSTIGFGHLIKKKEAYLLKNLHSEFFLLSLFELDFNKALTDYKKNYAKRGFSKECEEVLIEMIFQLGIKNQKKFIKMNEYLKNKLCFMAAFEMRNSKWYKQTPKRVNGLIKILLKKEYEKRR